MKAVKKLQKIGLVLVCALFITVSVSAQEVVLQQRERIAQADTKTEKRNKETNKNKKTQPENKVAENAGGNEDDSDIAAITNYYVNYLTEYRLGPEDVISVQVFGQCPDYCRDEITVPPTAIISYPLIREGIFVGGKSIEQIRDEITKKLDEYIIDPNVMVTLVKVGSARYGVVGKVEKQGNFLMTRRISIFDAITESGGISKEGDKKKAIILRPNAENKFDPILVNLKEIEEGKAAMAYLQPGDQVLIPKQGFNFNTILEAAGKISVFRLLLGSPF
jgi:polysaccharide export outer membrane protein